MSYMWFYLNQFIKKNKIYSNIVDKCLCEKENFFSPFVFL